MRYLNLEQAKYYTSIYCHSHETFTQIPKALISGMSAPNTHSGFALLDQHLFPLSIKLEVGVDYTDMVTSSSHQL